MGNSDVPEHDRRTVFVQGISFDMQDAQFEEAFSEIGPIRKSFLLRRRGEKRHKVLVLCSVESCADSICWQKMPELNMSDVHAGVRLCAICSA